MGSSTAAWRRDIAARVPGRARRSGRNPKVTVPLLQRDHARRQIDDRTTHVSPDLVFFAEATTLSTPARFGIRRRTVNDPLGAVVVRVPEKTLMPLSLIATFQTWPARFESTSNSVSMKPLSWASVSFDCDPALH
jgi:hypothetical protein